MDLIRSIKLFCLIFILLLMASCEQKSSQKQKTISYDFESDSVDACWIALNTRIKTDAFSGQWCTTVNETSQYGGGYASVFPDSLQGKNIKLNFSARVKAKNTLSNVNIAFALSIGDSVIFWNSVEIKKVLKESDKWELLQHSLNFPASHTGKIITFKTFLWCADGKSEGYMDDLEISFEELKLKSFVPAIARWTEDKNSFLKSAKLYIENGNIKDTTIKGELSELKFIPSTNNSALAIFTNNAMNCSITAKYDSNRELIVTSKIVFSSPLEIKRIAIVFQLDDIPTEFYLPGGVFQKAVQQEVWLGKEGLKFRYNNQAMLLYHQPNISSIQYQQLNNQLWVNLDYAGDHPQIHSPLLNSGARGVFENWSSSVYKKDDVLNSKFIFYLNEDQKSLPRFMSSPNGFEANYIWTEHADYGDLRTHKAVCFGDENISEAQNAVGGFVKHKIPVTKSVFYSNPDLHNNSVSDNRFNTPVANIIQTPGYLNFLKDLKTNGFEICLHTPDQFTSNKELLKEAVTFFKNNFNSTTWIDHGYDNGEGDNREDFVCDGLIPSSKYFMRNVWEESETKYFWNSYHEDIAPFNGTGFENHLVSPFYGFGGAFPYPILFQNPTRSGNLYSWVSNSLLDFDDANWWSYYYNDKTLTEFVNSRGTLINHCYPARVNNHNGFWTMDQGVIKAHPEFEKVLALLSSYRDKGKLNITTIPEYAQYMIDIANVEVKPAMNGAYEIKNKSGRTIKGFSMVVKASSVEVLNQPFNSKKVKDEIIFWFDLNDSCIINIK